MLQDAIQVLDKIQEALAKIQSADKDRASIIRKAVTETRIYIGKIVRLGMNNRDYEHEANLSRLWSDAAQAYRKVNYSITQDCDKMSSFWADPNALESSSISRIIDFANTLLEEVHGLFPDL
ncbi:hypothetical protein [Alkalinema sp. FACHB-956]|uniref:hypothetical protein n=1 Tax=Alkalinema sp. FACHB-956 TaxID=2692768 RepID=UPI0016874E41|nr:hypothetical protein [Alkalinema sp. FACHB-956]MBD2325407.1 hypothetical protein [Alkalinema sp. FACHB-956]